MNAAPLPGGLAGLVVLSAQRGARGLRALIQVLDGIRKNGFDPLHSVDLFACWYTVPLILLYLRALPIHTMINTHYLLPAVRRAGRQSAAVGRVETSLDSLNGSLTTPRRIADGCVRPPGLRVRMESRSPNFDLRIRPLIQHDLHTHSSAEISRDSS
jgi:hypothetical protein